jgi:hypothetical protein
MRVRPLLLTALLLMSVVPGTARLRASPPTGMPAPEDRKGAGAGCRGSDVSEPNGFVGKSLLVFGC